MTLQVETCTDKYIYISSPTFAFYLFLRGSFQLWGYILRFYCFPQNVVRVVHSQNHLSYNRKLIYYFQYPLQTDAWVSFKS